MILVKNFCQTSFKSILPHQFKHLLRNPVYWYEDMKKTVFFKWSKQQKDMIYKKYRPIKKVKADFKDTLVLPLGDEQQYMQLMQQFVKDPKIPLSSQNVAMLMYNFTKRKLITDDMIDYFGDSIYNNRGLYSSRSLFGIIYASIIFDRKQFINFAFKQYHLQNFKFTSNQSLQIIEALNENKTWGIKQKHQFWQNQFKKLFLPQFVSKYTRKIEYPFKLYDIFTKFEYYNPVVWNKIISLMSNKKGWLRTIIIQKLYPLTGTFPEAKQLFDKYYIELSTNKNITWRYNLQQLRLYTSQEMIAKSQDNIQLSQKYYSLFDQSQVQEYNQKFSIWLQTQTIKQQRQVIKDKAQSLAYAIHERYYALKQDGIDLSKLTKEQFVDLFGKYDQDILKQVSSQQWMKGGKQKYQNNPPVVNKKQKTKKKRINKLLKMFKIKIDDNKIQQILQNYYKFQLIYLYSIILYYYYYYYFYYFYVQKINISYHIYQHKCFFVLFLFFNIQFHRLHCQIYYFYFLFKLIQHQGTHLEQVQSMDSQFKFIRFLSI